MDTVYTIFHFIVAIGILVSIHEFGHFWVARKSGVKVLRFSVGFGKVVWSYQKTAESTEYVVSAIPLGGYVKMVDEREDKVKEEDLPYAFNRQPLYARAAIVAAGPIFNLLLAIALLWAVFVVGETGIRPIVGAIEPGTLVADAGFIEGEEIIAINDQPAPTWSEAMGHLFSSAVQGEQEISVKVKNDDNIESLHFLTITAEDAMTPEKLFKRLGLKPWVPTLAPVISKVLDNGAAQAAGMQSGDLIISADDIQIKDWTQWVDYIKSRPEVSIHVIVDRDGVQLPMTIVPKRFEKEEKDIGRIGASVKVPDDLLSVLRVEYSLPPGAALVKAFERTWFYSVNTLSMMGKMLLGTASSKNLSGPISIAQYAGQSAELGLVPFMKFLALVSVSLGVLNLLPVPVLDGGHLMFFLIEAVKGSPVSEKIQIYFQNLGILILMSLMIFAVFVDLERLFQ